MPARLCGFFRSENAATADKERAAAAAAGGPEESPASARSASPLTGSPTAVSRALLPPPTAAQLRRAQQAPGVTMVEFPARRPATAAYRRTTTPRGASLKTPRGGNVVSSREKSSER